MEKRTRRGLAAIKKYVRNLAFMSPRDIGLFLRSARTDVAIARMRGVADDETAFNEAYASGDPWASGEKRYFYQRHKYHVLAALLPSSRRFGRALDIGAGLGLLARRIAERADQVVGLDISQNAVDTARALHSDISHLHFEQGDMRAIPVSHNGSFDLILLVDTIYYLPQPIGDETLKALALRFSALLAPGGLCLLANHFFFSADQDSRLSRRIHRAFAWSPGFQVVSEHRRPFYLISLLNGADGIEGSALGRPDACRS